VFLAVTLVAAVFAGTTVANASTAAPDAVAGALAGPAAGQQQVGTHAQTRGSRGAEAVTDYTSRNWDGYFATAPSHGTDFTSVHAKWVEPTLPACTPFEDQWVVFWVGLDGWWNDVVEQGGSSAHCVFGLWKQEALWWEMYPSNDITTGPSISPGDTIEATVTYDTSAKQFDIVVKDDTNGASLNQTESCASDMHGCPRTSAEVISETPIGGSGPDGTFDLPDYQSATYQDISVTDANGNTGSLTNSNWDLGDVTQVTNKVTRQNTGALDPTGSSFTTTWVHG
jgi:hypothetical protein